MKLTVVSSPLSPHSPHAEPEGLPSRDSFWVDWWVLVRFFHPAYARVASWLLCSVVDTTLVRGWPVVWWRQKEAKNLLCLPTFPHLHQTRAGSLQRSSRAFPMLPENPELTPQAAADLRALLLNKQCSSSHRNKCPSKHAYAIEGITLIFWFRN